MAARILSGGIRPVEMTGHNLFIPKVSQPWHLYGLEWAGVEDETGKNLWFLNNDETPDLTVDGRPATYEFWKCL